MITVITPSIKVLTLIFAFCPQISAAEGLTSTAFLKWGRDAQTNYIRISVRMLAIATAASPRYDKVGRCIGQYYLAPENEKQGHAYIIDQMKRFPDYHAQAVIFGVLRKRCGGLD